MSRISDERLRELPVILATKEVMSCGCQTKTNDPDYHDPDCLYRLLCEFAALVSELMESREALKWEAIARALYDLLDDCDTADDIAKENDAEFRRLVRKAHQSRFLYGRPDADGLAVHFGIDGKEDG